MAVPAQIVSTILLRLDYRPSPIPSSDFSMPVTFVLTADQAFPKIKTGC